MANAIDQTLRKCYASSLCADFLNPDGHQAYRHDPPFVHDLFSLKTKRGGGGYRPTVQRAQYLNTVNNVLPQLLANETGLWRSLESIPGKESFTKENSSNRWNTFINSGSAYAKALVSEWHRLRDLRK